MNRSPYPFRDFVRAKDNLVQALVELGETYAMLTGETGTGKTALLRELRGQLDRTRHKVLYFSVTGDTDRLCFECEARARCTSQVRIDLIVERRPFRLLLAYTSARAYLTVRPGGFELQPGGRLRPVVDHALAAADTASSRALRERPARLLLARRRRRRGPTW